jgi:hypothetical protein
MYRSSYWKDNIEEYIIIKLSDKSIWFKDSNGDESRELLNTKDYCWFNTLKEAIEWKQSKLDFELKQAESRVKYVKDKLERFRLSNGI